MGRLYHIEQSNTFSPTHLVLLVVYGQSCQLVSLCELHLLYAEYSICKKCIYYIFNIIISLFSHLSFKTFRCHILNYIQYMKFQTKKMHSDSMERAS